ncbi:MAG: hypothetical protein RBG13Loki_1127 [Promethearchaeota archaeon CR_4]|nr:MAG: hypothetical protein RBG13Loki_1127 [Candidatus Lokiarchaeota archaeon CR_4]
MSDTRRERIYCSECGHEIDAEFVERLRQGETVFCEACGSRITVKIQKRVGLPRAEKTQPQTTYTPPRTPEPPIKNTRVAPEPTMDDILGAQRGKGGAGSEASASKDNIPDWRTSWSKSDQSKIDRAIQRLNKLSRSIGILIFVIMVLVNLTALITSVRTASFSWQVASGHIAALACALGSLTVDARFRNMIKKKDYSFRGIDLIVWGFVGCFGYGVGALVLAKGITIFVYSLHPKSGFPHLTRTQKFHVIISRLNANSASVGFLIWFGTFPLAITTAIAMHAPGLISFVVMGFIALLLDKFLFTPKLKGSLKGRRNVGLGVGMIVVGILGAMDCGMGVVLILKGVAVIVISSISDRQPKPQVPSSQPKPLPKPEKGEEIIPAAKVTKVASLPSPIPFPIPKTEIPDFIPQKPITPQSTPTVVPIKKIPPSIKTTEHSVQEQSVPPISGDFEKQAAIQGYLNHVYTVISSKIRDRIQKLDIPENEKREVIDGLLNLTPQEQEQFLTELEELARRLMPEIVGRILRLNLTKEQNEVLLRQLEYLSDQEQLEFVAELERAKSGAV